MLLYARAAVGEPRARACKTMRETTDGFEIARRDLEIRGPGEFLGARQSGAAMLRFADLENDGWLIDPARAAAATCSSEYPDAVRSISRAGSAAREQYLKA